MTPGNVEDNEEYEISKYLLEKFICSQAVLNVVGEHRFLVYKIIKFLHEHVYTWETLYLHHLRNEVLHLDVAHTSAHEGMNHGLKCHSCGLKPIMNLDTSANTLNIQTSIKVRECEEIILQDATQTHKRWSDLPTSRHTTSFGEGILQEMMPRINDYVAKLVARTPDIQTFQVFYLNTRTFDSKVTELPCKMANMDTNTPSLNMGTNTDNDTIQSICQTIPDSPIPIFSRIWIVTVHQTGTMLCSCKHFERMGLPCVHMACVANCVMKQKSLDPLLHHFLVSHTMTLWSVGGVATCIMPTDLQHHHTL
jgi:hypothetical protein